MSNTDKILNSINNLKRAEAPYHFYAGVRAKMQRKQTSPLTAFVYKPAYAIGLLAIFLVVNITVLSIVNKKWEKADYISGSQTFAREYNLTTQALGQ